MANPFVWQMVKEAVEKLGGRTTNSEIKRYIKDRYGTVNETTINCTILICCVNKQSRINWPENSKPRLAISQYDFLYSTGRGQVELYDRDKHGDWEIRQEDSGALTVCKVNSKPLEEAHRTTTNQNQTDIRETNSKDEDLFFPWEAHLRDFIAKNLSSMDVGGTTLRLYVDNDGIDGVEYPTDVGRIDILAIDQNDNFVVIELKLSRGSDNALGQLLRYMGWIKSKYPQKTVQGIIVAGDIDNKLKYAASIVRDITLFKYQISFSLYQESLDTGSML